MHDLVDVVAQRGVRREEVADEVFEVAGELVVRGEVVGGVHDAERGALLEGVLEEGEREEDAAEHPDVCLDVYLELEVGVAHLGGPVRDGGFFVELFHGLLVVFLRDESGERGVLEVDDIAADRAEVAELEVLAVEEDVLDLEVAVRQGRAHAVHHADAAADLLEDLEAVRLAELLVLPLLHQVEERAFGHVLEQAVEDLRVVLPHLLHAEALDDVRRLGHGRLG